MLLVHNSDDKYYLYITMMSSKCKICFNKKAYTIELHKQISTNLPLNLYKKS